MKKGKNKPLRVGFDLDGVVLYNPIRTFRPIASRIKSLVFRKSLTDKFYFPKSFVEQYLWKILHKTSFTPAEGLTLLEKYVDNNKIEAYLITSRYSFLEKDFTDWVKKINRKKIFKECFYNQKNLQPNRFKELMIEKKQLDVFVEDNWGIVQKLMAKNKKTKIFWISNFFDRRIPYPYKFSSLKKAIKKIISLSS
ncbi:hypothetical protein GYA28_03155 [Candidatus Roizmanbacteria bacterium]|jgi:hypothetical protein|nr:hypothetical protein [Candidatus Roizmanbacteria bacterium]